MSPVLYILSYIVAGVITALIWDRVDESKDKFSAILGGICWPFVVGFFAFVGLACLLFFWIIPLADWWEDRTRKRKYSK